MFRYLVTSVFLLIYIPASLAAEKSELSFQSGVKYFKKKEYKSALSFFKKAHTQGMRKSSLYYNLGVSYYKLGLYNEAKTNFNHLSNDNNFKQIINFNLGLIAEKQKQKKNQ